MPPHAAIVSKMVRSRWLLQELTSSCRRKMGKRPKISIEKRVKEKTCVVEDSLEARTADAIMAELVDIEVGSLQYELVFRRRYSQSHAHCVPGPPL
jgi:hypothetical protein